MKKKRKKSKKQVLRERAWKVFSEWVRSKSADFAGYVRCITCNKVYIWNSGLIHAGHYIHGRLDFDEMNVHPQCRNCNYGFSRNDIHARYSLYMHRVYGAEKVEELIKKSVQKGNDYSLDELEEVIKKYANTK